MSHRSWVIHEPNFKLSKDNHPKLPMGGRLFIRAGAQSKGIQRPEVWVGLRVSISKKLSDDAGTTVWAARN